MHACGRCHSEIRAAFERGPHREPFKVLGFADCAECHDAHATNAPTMELLLGDDTVCVSCHGPGQAAFASVRQLTALAERIDQASTQWPRSDPRRRKMVASIHAMDVAELERLLRELTPSRAARPPEASDPPEAQRRSPFPIVLPFAVALLVTLLTLAWVMYRRRRKR